MIIETIVTYVRLKVEFFSTFNITVNISKCFVAIKVYVPLTCAKGIRINHLSVLWPYLILRLSNITAEQIT